MDQGHEVGLEAPFGRTLAARGVRYSSPEVRARQPIGLFPLSPFDAQVASPGLKVLESLWFESRIEELEDGALLPYEELYRLAPSEARAIGLPDTETDVPIELRTTGYPGGAEFRVIPVFHHPELGALEDASRRGPLLDLGETLLLLSESAWPLLQLLGRGAPAGMAGQLLFVAEVKQAAERCGARLDPFLESQDIVTPTGIGVEVEAEAPDRLRIRPTAEGVEGEIPGFAQARTRSSYTRADGVRRRRVVFGEEARRTADALRQRGELSGADVPRFFDNPEAYLPEGVDLSRFSLRVRGLVPRKYNSQPYVRLQPTEKRDWFALDVRVELAAETFGPVSGEHPEADGAGEGAVPVDGSEEGLAGADPLRGDAPPHLSPAVYAELCRQVSETGERYVLHGDSWIEIDPVSAAEYLQAWDAAEEDGEGGRGITAERARLVLDVISNVDELEFGDEQAEDDFARDFPAYPLPASLTADLMPHQELGYRWMRYLHERGHGGLLADDMGLGKTVQVIGLFAHLADAGQLQPSLVVLPTSLIENWKRELARFCPRIRRVYVHAGADRLRRADLIAQWEVVLTTYETLRRDQLVLGQVDWSVIACDEAQKVKNPTAQATSAVKGMKAKLRLAMTGTPVENGLSELWCIVDWAQPGKLGSQREFRERFERPMQAAEVHEDRLDLGRQLRNQLTPHYLRRTKQNVLHGLPPRTDPPLAPIPMGPRQQRLYVDIVRRVRSRDMIPLEGLQHLLSIASHPEVYQETGASIEALIAECPKLQETLEIVGEIAARGERAVVFTRLKRMQQILQGAILERFGVHAAILNGEVAGGRRQGLVDRFNQREGFGVLLLSPEAAGVGLNITGANHVIHYTRLWNPAKENQATDRVHRLGQTRPVSVYYPIIGGAETPSVEERLHRLLEEKRALARDVIRPRESLSVERELLGLFEEEP